MYVTRSIRLYKHIFIKVGGDCTVEDKYEVTLAEKLGARKLNKFLKEKNIEGYVLAGVEEFISSYRMPLDVFLENAEKVNDEEDK